MRKSLCLCGFVALSAVYAQLVSPIQISLNTGTDDLPTLLQTAPGRTTTSEAAETTNARPSTTRESSSSSPADVDDEPRTTSTTSELPAVATATSVVVVGALDSLIANTTFASSESQTASSESSESSLALSEERPIAASEPAASSTTTLFVAPSGFSLVLTATVIEENGSTVTRAFQTIVPHAEHAQKPLDDEEEQQLGTSSAALRISMSTSFGLLGFAIAGWQLLK